MTESRMLWKRVGLHSAVFRKGVLQPLGLGLPSWAKWLWSAKVRLGKGQAAALNPDSTPNSVANPVERGSVIVVYLTGEGQTDPPGQDGRIIVTDARKPLLRVTASIAGLPAEVLYAGSGAYLVSGVCQVNISIPMALERGTNPIEVQVGGIPSQRGVTIEVR